MLILAGVFFWDKRKIPGRRMSERGVGSRFTSERLFGDHTALAGVVEDAAGVHHGADVAEGFEMVHLAGGLDSNGGFVEVHGHDVAGLEDFAEAFGEFARIKFAG